MKKFDRRIMIPIIVFFLLICLGVVGYLVFKNININQANETYRQMQTTVAATDTTGSGTTTAESATTAVQTTQNPSDVAPRVENPIDFQQMMAINPDVYAWISIPDTNVDYPVAQSAEYDNFYLDHNIYKEYSFPGTIYSQSCNSKDWSDRVTLLYGHNMLDGSMFATLHQFRDADFFNSHPYFYIYTQNRKLTYEIVTAFDYDDKHIMNSYNFKDDKVFQEWIDEAKHPKDLYANVRESTKLDLNSKFVVLSTCQNGGDGRYLIQGVMIKDEPTKLAETTTEISENG